MKGVLWDLDGVLVDSRDAHFAAWRELFSELGVLFSAEDFLMTFGMNNAATIRGVLGDSLGHDDVERLSQRKEAAFRDAIRGRVKALPGAIEAVERFHRSGLRQAIASSAPPENLELIVGELRARRYFGALVSGAALPAKPAPDVFLAAAESLGLAAHDCTVIEDAVHGVEGARRAGMRCIAVTTTNPPDRLADADYVLSTLSDLPPDAWRNLFGIEPPATRT